MKLMLTMMKPLNEFLSEMYVYMCVMFAHVQMHRSKAACGHLSPSFMCVLKVESRSSG